MNCPDGLGATDVDIDRSSPDAVTGLLINAAESDVVVEPHQWLASMQSNHGDCVAGRHLLCLAECSKRRHLRGNMGRQIFGLDGKFWYVAERLVGTPSKKP